jgi:RNA polymerase sigma-70 factor (ECF subfamily)
LTQQSSWSHRHRRTFAFRARSETAKQTIFADCIFDPAKKNVRNRDVLVPEQSIQSKDTKLAWFQIGSKSNVSNDDSSFDARLVERLKRREESAFLELYDRFRSPVYRFLIHMSGSIAIAEELTQEVFTVVLDGLFSGKFGRFDPKKGTLEGYILGIARNLARMEFKRTRRLLSLESILETPNGEGFVQEFCEDSRFWNELTLHLNVRHLQAAILELPLHYREVVVLCSLQERRYRDAATILQCSEGTIASRMNRAKSLLAAMLKTPVPRAVET